jgi:hypothetical protein
VCLINHNIIFTEPENAATMIGFFGNLPASEHKCCVVEIDPIKLASDLRENNVGEDLETPDPVRYIRWYTAIQAGDPVIMPMIFSHFFGTVDELRIGIQVSDGRHRLKALCDLDIRRVSVVVPAVQAKIISAVYGG